MIQWNIFITTEISKFVFLPDILQNITTGYCSIWGRGGSCPISEISELQTQLRINLKGNWVKNILITTLPHHGLLPHEGTVTQNADSTFVTLGCHPWGGHGVKLEETKNNNLEQYKKFKIFTELKTKSINKSPQMRQLWDACVQWDIVFSLTANIHSRLTQDRAILYRTCLLFSLYKEAASLTPLKWTEIRCLFGGRSGVTGSNTSFQPCQGPQPCEAAFCKVCSVILPPATGWMQLPLGMAVCILKMGSKNEFLIQFGTWAPEVKIKGQSEHHPQVYRHSSHWSHQRIWSRVCYFSLD